jgi:hypothetical protein
MLYATLINDYCEVGHVGSRGFESFLNDNCDIVKKLQADGDELVRCCEILCREVPAERVYTFDGGDAQGIAEYW